MADKNAFIDKVKITIKSGDGGDGDRKSVV